MRSGPLVALLLGAIATPPSALTAQDNLTFGVAMTRLELSLDLDYQEGSLRGSATYTIANNSERPISQVPFNVGRLMTVQTAQLAGGQHLGFKQDVAVFSDSPRLQVNHVVVSLPQPIAPGAEANLRLEYSGFLVGYTETGSLYIQDRITWNAVADYLEDGDFTILRTDAFAWPVLGTLQRSVNRATPQPDFTFRAQVTVPEPYTVACSGRLVRQSTVRGRTTFLYESVAPVPFLNLPIAEYSFSEGDGVRIYHFPGDSVGGSRVLESIEKAQELLSTWFGPLSSPPDLVVMEIPEMWGSQASLTGGIIQTADVFGERGSMAPIYHELSHLWNARDLDLPSARWNEGLATFLQLRMAHELDGENLDDAARRIADRIVTQASQTPEIASIPFSRYGEVGLTDLSYRVGCLMFYSLYSEMGQASFDDAIGDFYQSHKDRGWTFDGLVSHLQARWPADLTGFFRDWIYTTGWYDQLQTGISPAAIGFER